MTDTQRNHWTTLTRTIRECAAAAEALSCGFRDNHGGSLGDPVEAADRLAAKLAEASEQAKRLQAQRTEREVKP